MSNEAFDRAVKALEPRMPDLHVWDLEMIVRTVLEAVREPTRDMVFAMGNHTLADPRKIWSAGINELLKP